MPARQSVGAKSEKGAATREKILAVAIDLMADYGYAGTSIAGICEGAGVAAPVLYWHFGSKKGLLGAVIEHVGHGWLDDIEARITFGEEPSDPVLRAAQRLNRAMEGYNALILDEHKRLRLLVLIALECSGQSDEVREALKRFGRRAQSAVVSNIEDVVGGTLPDLDLLAHTVISLIEGALIRHVIDPEGTDLDLLWGELRQTIVLAVAHRAGALGR